MKLLVIIIALISAVGASAQTRDYRSMTPEELAAFEAAYGIEHGPRWRFRKPKQSPFTVSLGPNIIMSHIPVKFAKGVNHDFGFDASITYRNLYLDYNHSFTKSYFTFQGIAAGYAFTFANEENGMVISPNFGIGAAKVDIPTLAGYYRHTYTMLGLGADFRFYMGYAVMGFNYRYSVVSEDFSANIHTINFDFGIRIWKDPRKKLQQARQTIIRQPSTLF